MRTDRQRAGLAVGGALLLAACIAAAAAPLGRAAPAFTLPNLKEGGAPIALADYRGKIVYLDLWASWCAPCRISMPELDALRVKLRGQPFEIVSVNVDAEPAAARAFLEDVRAGYPIASDREGQVMKALGVTGLPTGFLLDHRGTIRLVHEGFQPGQSAFIEAHIDTLLAELKVEAAEN